MRGRTLFDCVTFVAFHASLDTVCLLALYGLISVPTEIVFEFHDFEFV